MTAAPFKELPAGTLFRLEGLSPITYAIPARRVPFGEMKATVPSTITPESLSEMLHNAGLTCDQTKPEKLAEIIKETETRLPAFGKASSFIIDKIEETPDGPCPSCVNRTRHGAKLSETKKTADSEWEPSEIANAYAQNLTAINGNFDELLSSYPAFQGRRANTWTQEGKFDTVEAISSLFINVAANASASVVTGINRETLFAALSNAIAPNADPNGKDYRVSDNRIIFLVLNYNPATQQADGMGFVFLEWDLYIKDYKRKTKKDHHQTKLTINAQSIIYDSATALQSQVDWLHHAHPVSVARLMAIPPKYNFKIFDVLPPLNNDTWVSALPVESKTAQLTALVFYAADLICLGNLDNKASKASSSYSIASTSGFTFTMSQTIGQETKMEAGVIFAKAEVTIKMSMTFTEQWNTEHTETIKFTLPGGAQAFVYKGYVRTRYILFDPNENKYTWGTQGKFNSNYLVTSEKVLKGDPVYSS